jgi:hypothetical protein
MIDGDHVPDNERQAVRHLYGLLFLLGWYEQQFRHALALFDACENRVPTDIPPKFDPPKYPIIEDQWHTLEAWKAMAARDGAMAIYNFGQALAAISPRLHDCPTISTSVVDHPALSDWLAKPSVPLCRAMMRFGTQSATHRTSMPR